MFDPSLAFKKSFPGKLKYIFFIFIFIGFGSDLVS